MPAPSAFRASIQLSTIQVTNAKLCFLSAICNYHPLPPAHVFSNQEWARFTSPFASLSFNEFGCSSVKSIANMRKTHLYSQPPRIFLEFLQTPKARNCKLPGKVICSICANCLFLLTYQLVRNKDVLTWMLQGQREKSKLDEMPWLSFGNLLRDLTLRDLQGQSECGYLFGCSFPKQLLSWLQGLCFWSLTGGCHSPSCPWGSPEAYQQLCEDPFLSARSLCRKPVLGKTQLEKCHQTSGTPFATLLQSLQEPRA